MAEEFSEAHEKPVLYCNIDFEIRGSKIAQQIKTTVGGKVSVLEFLLL